MVDTGDLKSPVSNGVRVRLPPVAEGYVCVILQLTFRSRSMVRRFSKEKFYFENLGVDQEVFKLYI